MSARSDIPPLEYPNYSTEGSDGYTYERVRIADDYYLVTIVGAKAYTSGITSGASIATVPAAYRPTSIRVLVPKLLNDAAGNTGNLYIQITPAGVMKSAHGNIIAGSYICLSGSWIHKGH